MKNTMKQHKPIRVGVIGVGRGSSFASGATDLVGMGNFAHVPALCELPRLEALQIAPGAGKPSALHYMDTLKTVQAAGKNLQISLAPEEIQPALEQLSARGLFISTWARTETEARELLKNAERWSVDRG